MRNQRIHRNLNARVWSKTEHGRKVEHYPEVFLAPRAGERVQMVVRPAGRMRVIREGVKNVHAFLVFEPSGFQGDPRWVGQAVARAIEAHGLPEDITYDPFRATQFYTRGRRYRDVPVKSAGSVWCDLTGACWAWDIEELKT